MYAGTHGKHDYVYSRVIRITTISKQLTPILEAERRANPSCCKLFSCAATAGIAAHDFARRSGSQRGKTDHPQVFITKLILGTTTQFIWTVDAGMALVEYNVLEAPFGVDEREKVEERTITRRIPVR